MSRLRRGDGALAWRQRAALVIYGALAVTALPAYLLLAPRSHWSHPWLLVALGAIALVGEVHDIRLTSGIRLDANTAVAVMALAIGGPLPALAVWLLPLVAGATVLKRQRLWRVGNLANLGSFSWAMLAGAGVLAVGHGGPLGVHAVPALLAAALTLSLVSYVLGPQLYAPLWRGVRSGDVYRAFWEALPAELLILALGAAAAVLTHPLGVFALVLFVIIVVIPESTLTLAAHARPVGQLSPAAATGLYADALARALALSRAQRRQLTLVGRLAEAHCSERERLDLQPWAHAKLLLGDPATAAAWQVSEHWDGSGPAGSCRCEIPLAARVLTVAQAWSDLTAAGSPGLCHEQALLDLRAQAASRLDPDVVDAAVRVVELERHLTPVAAFQPRAHRVWLPAGMRHACAVNAEHIRA